MRLNRTLLQWGVFLLILGGIPLAVSQGLVPEDSVAEAWRLWPLLLVAWGVGLVLRRTPVEFLAGLASAALFGTILGSVVATGSLPIGCGGKDDGVPFQASNGQLAGNATIELTLNCGELNATAAGGTGWSLEGTADEAPAVESTADRLAIESRRRSTFGFVGSRERWNLVVPAEPTIDLGLTVNAGSANVDLAGAHVGSLSVNINAGSMTLDLARVAALRDLNVQLNAVGDPRVILPPLSFRGNFQANAAGNVRICPPSGAGLRILVEDTVAGRHNFGDRGLVRVGDAWETPNYGASAVRIDLDVQVNAGSYNLEAEGSCNG